MMKTINIIVPYFGKLPNYFPFFLLSCKKNPTINWTIITDCTNEYNYPDNVCRVGMSFEELRNKVKKLFDFEIALNTPYKLCDFKPAYGYIFESYIEGYDYWGYGDIDLVYGNLRDFLTDEVLSYDKIFDLGHFTLIKNERKFNIAFLQSKKYKNYYKKVFSSDKGYNFDENFLDVININHIFDELGYSIYKARYMADIYTKSSNFLLDRGDGKKEKKCNSVFIWNDGTLYRYIKSGPNIVRKEYMYIHFQKRMMDVHCSWEDLNVIKIIPNAFENLEIDVNGMQSMFDQIKKKNFNLQYFRIRYRNLKIKMYFWLRNLYKNI